MQIQREDNGSYVLSEVDSPLEEMLAAIPASLDPKGNHAAEDRLYPAPMKGSEGEALREEWTEYIKPDLRHLFETARDTVKGDLEQLLGGSTLIIPSEHIDAWLNALNQARLVLASRFELSEADLDKPVSYVLETERDLALFQVHFYGFVQECLIRGED